MPTSSQPLIAPVSPFVAFSDQLKGFAVGLGKIFDNGLEIFEGVRDRIEAIRIIGDDTVQAEPPTVQRPSNERIIAGVPINNTTLILGAAGILAAGFVVSRLIK